MFRVFLHMQAVQGGKHCYHRHYQGKEGGKLINTAKNKLPFQVGKDRVLAA